MFLGDLKLLVCISFSGWKTGWKPTRIPRADTCSVLWGSCECSHREVETSKSLRSTLEKQQLGPKIQGLDLF